jgi:hypothetical protein
LLPVAVSVSAFTLNYWQRRESRKRAWRRVMSEVVRWEDEEITDEARATALEMLIDFYHGEVYAYQEVGEEPDADEAQVLEALKGAIQTLHELANMCKRE